MSTISTQQELENFMYNVAWLRRTHGLSRSRMAAILGVSLHSLDRIERGDFPKNLSPEVLCGLMRWFGVTPGRIFSGRLDEEA